MKENLSMAMPLGLKLASRTDKDVTTATQRQVPCNKSGKEQLAFTRGIMGA